MLIINHPGKIKVSYEPVVHFLGCCVRQSARIVGIRRVPLSVAQLGLSPPDQAPTADRTDIGATDATSNLELLVGDKAICRFRFLYRPEYIFLSPTSDSAMVMREGRTKGVGKVLSLSCPSDAAHVNSLKMSHLRT